MSRARDLADSADKDIAGTLTLDGLSVSGDVAVDTNTLFVDASANSVGIGTSSPLKQLDVLGTSDTTPAVIRNGATTCRLMFGDSNSTNYPRLGSVGNNLAFTTSSTERMRIDASGNLLVGTTDTNPGGYTSGSGVEISELGIIRAARDGDTLVLNRVGSDGNIVTLRKDGSNVGRIGTRSSNLSIGSGDVSLEFNSPNDAILPSSTSTNNTRDAAIDLGLDTVRFKNLYLSGGVYLGGTGSANYLDDYEEGYFTVATTTGTVNSTEYGSYTKVGNIVHAQIYVASISDTSTVANLEFSLPFTASLTGQDSYVGSLMIRYLDTPTSEIQSMWSYVSGGFSVARAYYLADASTYQPITHDMFTSSLIGCRIGITYRTNS